MNEEGTKETEASSLTVRFLVWKPPGGSGAASQREARRGKRVARGGWADSVLAFGRVGLMVLAEQLTEVPSRTLGVREMGSPRESFGWR